MQDLSSWLEDRAYPTWRIEKEFRRVREYNILERSTLVKSCKIGVRLTITSHPLLKHSTLVIKKNLHILYSETEGRKVFTSKPFIAFSTSHNLKNYLVKAKVPPLVRRKRM